MKAKAPAMSLYVRDWLTDTELSACTPLVRGVWMDMLANMWLAPRRGILSGTREQLARICRCSVEEIDEFLNAQKVSRFANVTVRNGKVTIINRRMRREEIARKGNVNRQKRHRKKRNVQSNANSNAKVTPSSASSSSFASASALKTDLKHIPPKRPAGEKKPRERNLLWDKICEVFSLNPVTKSEKSRIGKIVSDLKLKNATPEEIATRLLNYKKHWPGITATPEALLKHWDTLRLSPSQAKVQAASGQQAKAAERTQARQDALDAEEKQTRRQEKALRDQFSAMTPAEKAELKAQVQKRRAPPGGWNAKTVMLEVLSILSKQK